MNARWPLASLGLLLLWGCGSSAGVSDPSPEEATGGDDTARAPDATPDALGFALLRRLEQQGRRPFSLTTRPPPPIDALLEPPAWTLPPSQRSPAASAAEAASAARLHTVEPGPGLATDRSGRIEAIALDPQHHLLLLSQLGEWDERALCLVTSEHAVTCAPTDLDGLAGVASAPGPGQWLVVARSQGDGGPSGLQVLALVSETADGLTNDLLPIGGVDGSGEACEDHSSYCTWLSGWSSHVTFRSSSCLTLRPGPRWAATHVRAGDLWLDERISEPGPETTHRVRGTRLVPAPCE